MSETEEERLKYREFVKQRNELNDNLPPDKRKNNRYVVYALQLYRAQELDAKKKELDSTARLMGLQAENYLT